MKKLFQTLFVSVFAILALPALAQAQPLLLRAPDSPEVYYVNTKLNAKKVMLTERVFKSYGNAWSAVQVVPQYQIDRYRDIRLVKLPDSPAIYYISGVTRQLVPTEQVFTANGFRWSEVVTVNYIDLSSYRLIEPLTARGARTSSTKASTSTPAKISVSIASAPKDDDHTVPARTDFIAHSINLKNTGRSDAHISSIKLDVLGLDANSQTVGDIFIADSNGNKFAGPFKTGVYGVSDLKLGTPITVPAGVNLNLKFIVSGNNPGMYIALRVSDISYIETNATVSAKFPLTGNYYRIVDEPLVYNHVRTVTVQITPLRRVITAGSRNLDVSKILLIEKTGDGDVYLNKLTLTIVGEQPDAWVRNLKLVDANNRTVASAGRVQNGLVTFNFNRGLVIPAKGRQSLTLKADFSAGIGYDVDFQIRRPEDVVMTTQVNDTTGHVVANLVSQPLSGSNAIQVVQGNALLTVNSVATSQRSTAKQVTVLNFDIKAQDSKRDVVFTGFNFKVDNFGPNHAITTIIVKDGSTVVAEEKVRAYWGITGNIGFEKPIYINTSSHHFQVIAVLSPKATQGDNFQATATDFKFVSADGFRDGDSWYVNGPKIILTK